MECGCPEILSDDLKVSKSAMKEIEHGIPNENGALILYLIENISLNNNGNYDRPGKARDALILLELNDTEISSLLSLVDNKNKYIRADAISILGSVKQIKQEIITALTNAIETDPDWIVRISAVDKLGDFGPPTSAVLSSLVHAINDKHDTIGTRSITAIGKFGKAASSTIPSILLALRNLDSDSSGNTLRETEIAKTLGAISLGDKETIDALISLFGGNYGVALQAGEALVALGRIGLAPLIKLLGNSDPYIRVEAIHALNEYTSPEIILENAYIAALQDENDMVRSKANYGLMSFDSEKSLKARELFALEEQTKKKMEAEKMKLEAQRLWSKGEIVATKEGDQNRKYPLELTKAFSFQGWNRQIYFVAEHEGKDRADTLSIWKKTNDKYKLLKSIDLDNSEVPTGSIENVVSFKKDGNIFWFYSIRYPGTEYYHDDRIFCINDRSELIPIEFERAPQWYRNKLNEDEGIWKGEINTINDNQLSFMFYIWKEGDSNASPSVGKVKGTYKIERTNSSICNGMNVVVDTYDFIPIESE